MDFITGKVDIGLLQVQHQKLVVLVTEKVTF